MLEPPQEVVDQAQQVNEEWLRCAPMDVADDESPALVDSDDSDSDEDNCDSDVEAEEESELDHARD